MTCHYQQPWIIKDAHFWTVVVVALIIIPCALAVFDTHRDRCSGSDYFQQTFSLAEQLCGTDRHVEELTSPYRQDLLKMASPNLSAFVVGATGAVGKELVKELARNPGISRVTLIGRRKVDLPQDDGESKYSKFEQKIVDFDKLAENHAADFTGYDVGFCSLGTTRGKAGREGFIKVDHDYQMAVGKLAKDGGVKHFNLVSSGNANKNSWLLYTQVKGQVEEEMKELGFPRLTIWQPNVLLVETPREESRPMEKVIRTLLGPLDHWRIMSIWVPVMAKVMVNHCFEPQTGPIEVITNRDINHKGQELSSKAAK